VAKRKPKRSTRPAARRPPPRARVARRSTPATWWWWLAIPLVVGAGFLLLNRGGGSSSRQGAFVGGDLHSLVADPATPNRLFVGGHQAVSESRDGGRTWQPVRSLDNADAMGWAFVAKTVWQSGHPGLHHSADGGQSFRQANDGLPSTDVHALGGTDRILYAASPAAGVFASTNDGAVWQMRTADVGQAFFGRILVDPTDPDHALAADARAGAVETADGGRTWRRLGGIDGALWVAWRASDPGRIVVSGNGAARSDDGGRTWQRLDVPNGVSIVEADPTEGRRLWAAAHDGARAKLWESTDVGVHWQSLQ